MCIERCPQDCAKCPLVTPTESIGVVKLIVMFFALVTLAVFFTACSESVCNDRCGYKRGKVIEDECYCKTEDSWVIKK